MNDPVLEAELNVAYGKFWRMQEALINLVDEAERVVLAEQDEGRTLPHLLAAINAGRALLGVGPLKLS